MYSSLRLKCLNFSFLKLWWLQSYIAIIGCGHISFITSYVIHFPCPLPTMQSLWWIKKLTPFLSCLLTALPPKVNIQLNMDFITYNNNHYWYPTLWISNYAILSNDLKFSYKNSESLWESHVHIVQHMTHKALITLAHSSYASKNFIKFWIGTKVN
jgi:hypothetical protein